MVDFEESGQHSLHVRCQLETVPDGTGNVEDVYCRPGTAEVVWAQERHFGCRESHPSLRERTENLIPCDTNSEVTRTFLTTS